MYPSYLLCVWPASKSALWPALPLPITHQEIAAELGSSREVISRILENFVSQGILSTGRGTIEVLDAGMLEETSLR
jgi:CRP/FNR family transcriptional regulator